MARRRRRNARRTVTPRRRRSTALVRNRRRRNGVLLSNRRHRRNPFTRRSRRRNPHPGLKGIVEGSVVAMAGMAITDFAQGFVPFSFGGALGKIGVRFGLAYGLGMAAEKFGFAKYANLLAVGGAVGAAQDLFRLFMGGGQTLVAAAPAPQQVAGRVAVDARLTGDDEGMGDIVRVPANYNQLGDIVTVPQWSGYY